MLFSNHAWSFRYLLYRAPKTPAIAAPISTTPAAVSCAAAHLILECFSEGHWPRKHL